MTAGEHLRARTALALTGAGEAATSAGQRAAGAVVSVSMATGRYTIEAGRSAAALAAAAIAAGARGASRSGEATRRFAWRAARSVRRLASSDAHAASTVMSGDAPPEQRILRATTKGSEPTTGRTGPAGKARTSIPYPRSREPLGLPRPGRRQVGRHTGGAYEPPEPPGPLSAAKRRPWLVAAPIVLMVIAAVLLAGARTPVHTAETRLSVGDQQVEIDQVPGTIAARIALASSYARLVDAQAVVAPLAEAVGQDSGQVAARLSGSPIPESPLFFVEATGSSEASAIELSNLAAESLRSYIAQLAVDEGEAPRLLKEFGEAQARVEQLAIEVGQANDAFGRSETAANRQALAKARAAFATAELQATELRRQYERANQFDEAANTVVVVNPASSASNDAASFRNRLIFTAVVLGGLIGIALAWAVARFLPGRLTRE
jgi:hypothetical protein